jgi:NO-binding membrane sensor protein with MHYT domain
MLRDFLPRRFAERVVAGWAIAVTGLMVLGWVTHAPGDLGVIVHPPLWYDTLVIVLTVVAALAGYVYGVGVDDRASMARKGVLTGSPSLRLLASRRISVPVGHFRRCRPTCCRSPRPS